MEQKNLIIAVVLATIVLFGWQYFYEAPISEQKAKYKQSEQIKQREEVAKLASAHEESLLERNQAQASSPRVKISSRHLKGSISLVGGRIDDLILLNYSLDAKADSEPVTLLSPAKTKNPYFAEFGWLSNSGIDLPNSNTLWKADKEVLEPNQKLTLVWTNNQGVKFALEFFLDEEYMISVKQLVNNYSNQAITYHNYGLISRLEDG